MCRPQHQPPQQAALGTRCKDQPFARQSRQTTVMIWSIACFTEKTEEVLISTWQMGARKIGVIPQTTDEQVLAFKKSLCLRGMVYSRLSMNRFVGILIIPIACGC
jgi:hypothetical protein